jgi:hypothetical protein
MFTAAERGELWRRYEAGESTHGIGRALGRANPVIYGMLKRTGGITPPEAVPFVEGVEFGGSEQISRGVLQALSGPAAADQTAWESAGRPKRCLRAKNLQLQQIIAVN